MSVPENKIHQIEEHQEVEKAEAELEANKAQALNENLPHHSRLAAAMNMVEASLEQIEHKAKESYYAEHKEDLKKDDQIIENLDQAIYEKTHHHPAHENLTPAEIKDGKADKLEANAPLARRVSTGLDMVEGALEGLEHRAKALYQEKSQKLPEPDDIKQRIAKNAETLKKLDEQLQAKLDASNTNNEISSPRDIKEGTVERRTTQLQENIQAREADANYEAHKTQATDSSQPLGDRLQAGFKMVGDTFEGAEHRAKGALTEQVQDFSTTKVHDIIENDKAKEEAYLAKVADAKFEAHKALATDPDQPLERRISNGFRMVNDVILGVEHKVKEVYYEHANTTGIEDIKEGTVETTKLKLEEITLAKQADDHFESHKALVADPDLPVVDRLKAGVELVGDAIEGLEHRVKAAFYEQQ